MHPLHMYVCMHVCVCVRFLAAGLKLFTKHAGQFGSCLMDHYRTVFDVMSKLCGHINSEMKKTSYAALESFLKQVAVWIYRSSVLCSLM